MYDVAQKVGDPALIGALGASLALIAMICRYDGQRKKKAPLPKGFPFDPLAAREPYLKAYSHLVTMEAAGSIVDPEFPTASEYALQMFRQSSVAVRKQLAPESKSDEEQT